MRKWLILGILLLGFLLRSYDLYSYPSGFTPDEASFGYDAYSILKTGRDQWGRQLPLTLESFGDFKPALYSYILVPSVALFGLNKFSVRFPNALVGTLAVLFTYLMVEELFKSRKEGLLASKHKVVAKTAALLLAVSSWHVMLSRGGFEANLTTLLTPLAVYLFLKGLKKPKALILSAFVFGLNLFSYHSARVVTPLLLLMLVFAYRKELLGIEKKKLLAPVFIFFTLLALTIYTLFSGAGRRASDVSIFRGALEEAAPDRLKAINRGLSPFIARLMHNKYQVAVRRFANNYKQYFSVRFLFTEGPAEATYGMIPGRGVLYWFELPFLLSFIVLLFKSKEKRLLLLLLGWLLISPLPAALATGKGYAGNRAAGMLPSVQIILAMGAVYLYILSKKVAKRKLANYARAEYIFVSLIFFIFFIKDYFASPPTIAAEAMLSGNLEAAEWLNTNAGSAQIIVSRKLSEPHIYVAFANKWNPDNYQAAAVDWSRYKKEGLLFLDQLGEYSLGNYTFSDIDLESYRQKKVLLVGRPEEFPEAAESSIIKTIYYPDRNPAILVVDPMIQGYAKAY